MSFIVCIPQLALCPLTFATVTSSQYWTRLIRASMIGASKFKHEMMTEEEIEFYMVSYESLVYIICIGTTFVSFTSKAWIILFSLQMPNDFHAVQARLDHMRIKRPKFICINDDVQGDPDPRVFRALRNFYESYFPKPSPFELPYGETNPYLHYDDLMAYWAAKHGGQNDHGSFQQKSSYVSVEESRPIAPEETRDSTTGNFPNIAHTQDSIVGRALSHSPSIAPNHRLNDESMTSRARTASQSRRAVPIDVVMWAVGVGATMGAIAVLVVLKIVGKARKLHAD